MALRSPLLATALIAAVFTSLACVETNADNLDKDVGRGTFFVSITETLQERDSLEAVPTERNIASELITRKLMLHGFLLAESKEEARYLIEGSLKCKWNQLLTFKFRQREEILEYQYEAEFLCALTDTTQPETDGDPTKSLRLERVDIPFQKNGRQKDNLAKIDIRRLVGTTVGDRIVNGRLLGSKKFTLLRDALGDVYEERSANKIVSEMHELGQVAVPYLLDMLTDDRPVKVSASYLDLEEWNKDAFRYYHVADLALEEILERHSGLSLDSSEDYRLRVRLAWTWAWEDILKIPEKYRESRSKRKTAVKARPRGESSDEETSDDKKKESTTGGG